MARLLTIAELSRKLSIAESTLRYRSKMFEDFLPTNGAGRKKRFEESCIERFAYIDELFNKGLVTEDVKAELEMKYQSEVVAYIHEETHTDIKNISQSLTSSENNTQFIFEVKELLVPIIKVIENQEIIIQELQKQNQFLLNTGQEKSEKKSFWGTVFGR